MLVQELHSMLVLELGSTQVLELGSKQLLELERNNHCCYRRIRVSEDELANHHRCTNGHDHHNQQQVHKLEHMQVHSQQPLRRNHDCEDRKANQLVRRDQQKLG